MSQCAGLFSCGDGMHGKITHPSPTSLTYPAALYMLVWCHTVLCTAREDASRVGGCRSRHSALGTLLARLPQQPPHWLTRPWLQSPAELEWQPYRPHLQSVYIASESCVLESSMLSEGCANSLQLQDKLPKTPMCGVQAANPLIFLQVHPDFVVMLG